METDIRIGRWLGCLLDWHGCSAWNIVKDEALLEDKPFPRYVFIGS